MNLHLAQHLAKSLMNEHGLTELGWSFAFDHARRRFGCCNLTQQRITLSRPLTLLNDESQVRDTLLHEIAHALTPHDGHGALWKTMCRKIGARPIRCYRENEIVAPPRPAARYWMSCPACGWVIQRQRRPRRKLICRTCSSSVVFSSKSPAQPSVAAPTTTPPATQ